MSYRWLILPQSRINNILPVFDFTKIENISYLTSNLCIIYQQPYKVYFVS